MWCESQEETHVHDGDGLFAGGAEILDHVLDQHRAFGDDAICDMC